LGIKTTRRKPPPATRKPPPATRRVVRTRSRKPRFDRWFDQLCAVLFTVFGNNNLVHRQLRAGVTWDSMHALFDTHDRHWSRNVRKCGRLRPQMKAFWLRCVDAL
jgi:hypothetical protein